MKSLKKSFFFHSAKLLRFFFEPRIFALKKNFQGKIVINCSIGSTTFIDYPEKLILHNGVYIGHHNFIEASNGIEINEGCQITDFVSITSHSSHISIRLYGQEYYKFQKHKGYICGSIEIGKYTFIGPHSVIMPGTKIGKGCIVAAYSYVKGIFPDFSIIKGNPAKIIGDTRNIDKIYLEEDDELKRFYSSWAD